MITNLQEARNFNFKKTQKQYYMIVDNKIFVDNHGVSSFNNEKELWNAFYKSFYWSRVNECIDFDQKFFHKENDHKWRKEFEQKALNNLSIEIKSYETELI
jgi:hypothetical protein